MSLAIYTRILLIAILLFSPFVVNAQEGDGIVAVGGEMVLRIRTAGSYSSIQQRTDAVNDRLPVILGLNNLSGADVTVQEAGKGNYKILVRNQLLLMVTPEDGKANGISAPQQAENWAAALRRVLPQVSALVNPRAVSDKLQSINGTVFYRQPSALPSGSVLVVRLMDVSHADSPPVVVSEARAPIKTHGPIPFEIKYPPTQIDTTHTYVLDARVSAGGKTRWVGARRYPVLTKGHTKDKVSITLTQAPAGH